MAIDSAPRRLGRAVAVLAAGAAFTGLGWLLFVSLPAGDVAVLLGVLITVGVGVLGLRAGARWVDAVIPTYNVAEVAVEGQITRGGTRTIPPSPIGARADEVVDQIEAADGGPADALLLKLDTPGGEVVPSDDIRLAAEAFEGPTVAYATDVCASGGYWIASGCDYLVAREGSLIGSVGVIGSRINAADLAERLGLTYERFAAGKYKDAGNSLREIDEDERAYLQGLIDDYYDVFVERVAEGRDLDLEAVRDTEARVFLGPDAEARDLVDAVGTRDDAVGELEARLGTEASVRRFEPSRSFPERLGMAAAAVAAGVTDGVWGSSRLRLR